MAGAFDRAMPYLSYGLQQMDSFGSEWERQQGMADMEAMSKKRNQIAQKLLLNKPITQNTVTSLMAAGLTQEAQIAADVLEIIKTEDREDREFQFEVASEVPDMMMQLADILRRSPQEQRAQVYENMVMQSESIPNEIEKTITQAALQRMLLSIVEPITDPNTGQQMTRADGNPAVMPSMSDRNLAAVYDSAFGAEQVLEKQKSMLSSQARITEANIAEAGKDRRLERKIEVLYPKGDEVAQLPHAGDPGSLMNMLSGDEQLSGGTQTGAPATQTTPTGTKLPPAAQKTAVKPSGGSFTPGRQTQDAIQKFSKFASAKGSIRGTQAKEKRRTAGLLEKYLADFSENQSQDKSDFMSDLASNMKLTASNAVEFNSILSQAGASDLKPKDYGDIYRSWLEKTEGKEAAQRYDRSMESWKDAAGKIKDLKDVSTNEAYEAMYDKFKGAKRVIKSEIPMKHALKNGLADGSVSLKKGKYRGTEYYVVYDSGSGDMLGLFRP